MCTPCLTAASARGLWLLFTLVVGRVKPLDEAEGRIISSLFPAMDTAAAPLPGWKVVWKRDPPHPRAPVHLSAALSSLITGHSPERTPALQHATGVTPPSLSVASSPGPPGSAPPSSGRLSWLSLLGPVLISHIPSVFTQ